jgi:hypothetical protein
MNASSSYLCGAQGLDPLVNGAERGLVVVVLDDGDDQERVIAQKPAVARVLVVGIIDRRLERGGHRLAGDATAIDANLGDAGERFFEVLLAAGDVSQPAVEVAAAVRRVRAGGEDDARAGLLVARIELRAAVGRVALRVTTVGADATVVEIYASLVLAERMWTSKSGSCCSIASMKPGKLARSRS